jgi:hypothetical protein
MAKAAFTKNIFFTSKLDLNIIKNLVKYYIRIIVLYGAETWSLRKLDQKYMGSFEVRCWSKTEKIGPIL